MSGCRWWWCGSWLVLCAAALAEPPVPLPTAEAETVVPLKLHEGLSVFGQPSASVVRTVPSLGLVAKANAWSTVSIVEVPADTVPGAAPQRPHHALRFGLDAPRSWLRGRGVDSTDCIGQLRAPSKLRSDSRTGTISFEAQVKLGMQCRF